jgi:hypothetical protein
MVQAGLVILLTMLSATEISGRWSGTMEQKTDDGRTGRMSLVVQLSQQGEEISGKAGPDETNLAPIQNARLEGSRLTFSVTLPPLPGSDAGPTWRFDLTSSGDKMEGKGEGNVGARSLGSTQVSLSRQK